MYTAGVQRALGFDIPDNLRSSDFAEENLHLRSINFLKEPIQTGDIIGLWRNGETNTKRIHLGILRWNETEHIVEVLHASKDRKKVVVSEIGELLLDPKYAQIAFIKRAITKCDHLYRPHLLEILGLHESTKLRRGV